MDNHKEGQKKKCKGRIVARGFQEQEKPQSDSPAVLRALVKTFVVTAANEGFEICSIDITGAFLQAEDLDREVFVKPPKDIRKDGILWRLKKPLYGLYDSSRKFYIRVKKMSKDFGLEVLEGDAAYFYMMKDGKLYGQISTHVDDFNMAGEKEFIEDMVKKISCELKVSKIEHGQFRFTGIDFKKTSEGIEMSMEDYAKSMEKIGAFRSGRSEPLIVLEMKVYRKYTGKLMWLAENCRPDLAFTALSMSQKTSKATVADLKKINKVIDRVHERESRVMLGK